MRAKTFIYLDNAATTFCSEKVSGALSAFYAAPHGNPSAAHGLGFEAARLIQSARSFFAEAFGARPEQVIFTAGGTEANNLGISGFLERNRKEKRPVILSSPIEHSSVARNLEHWKKGGYDLRYIRVHRDGEIDLDDLKQKLSSEVALVSVMAVNNEIGTIEPIAEIGRLIRTVDPQIIFHVDAVQAFGKLPLKFEAWNIDLLTLSSHKIHGPAGAGALIKSGRVGLEPLVYGGGQEWGLRSGTESAGMIHGFHLAAEEVLSCQRQNHDHVKKLKEIFRKGLERIDFMLKINTPLEKSSPYILNVSFPGYPSEVMLRMLEQERILASAGSSCHARSKKGVSVLSAIGCLPREQQSAVRFSLSSRTSESEIQEVLEALPRALRRLNG